MEIEVYRIFRNAPEQREKLSDTEIKKWLKRHYAIPTQSLFGEVMQGKHRFIRGVFSDLEVWIDGKGPGFGD